MTLFNRLLGFVRTTPGLERAILRLLPRILVFGTLVLTIPSLAVRIFVSTGTEAEIAKQILTVDIYCISLIVLHWTVMLTAAIAACIVFVMKGPA